jgi:hypothetical protein
MKISISRRFSLLAIVAAIGLLGATSSVMTPPAGAAGTSPAAVTSGFKWLYWGTYSTPHACNSEGDKVVLEFNSGYTFKCVEVTEGSYFVYKLYIGVPNPGAASLAVGPSLKSTAGEAVSAVHVANAFSPAVPDIRWFYWATYSTLHACNVEGQWLYLNYEISTWKCSEYSEGDYFVWELYVVLGHGPGS